MMPDMLFPWGDSLLSLHASKDAVHTIGVRGAATQQQNKQAIISSQCVLDVNHNILIRRVRNF